VSPATIDRAVLAYYKDRTVADIEREILDLELIASEWYEVDLGGQRSVDLTTAIERTSGAGFNGFERAADGVWLFGLLCDGCQNPAPIALTVLRPSVGAMN